MLQSKQTITTWDNQTLEWPFSHKPAREVQLRALSRGYGKEGFAYFLRQRLGKTWLAYAEYCLLRAQGKVQWMIVIAPNSMKEQWRLNIEEVDLFTPICIYDSQAKKDTEFWFDNNKRGGVLIINYESAKTFMKNLMWTRFDNSKTYLCIDESTKIKEYNAKMTKAVLELALGIRYKRVLTGKPQGNSHADMWPQLKAINATERGYFQHKYTFCVVGGWQGRSVVKNINTQMLKDEMAPHCYIAEDKFIKGFEKVYEPLRYVELSGEQRELYKTMEDELIVELSSGVKITAPIALVKYLRLQQISSGIAGDPDGVQHNVIPPSRNPRIHSVVDILENEIDNKVIIPCRFRLSIDNLYKVLTEKGYKCSVIIGGMGSKIEEQKRLFNHDDHDVLLAQTQVLSYGHTLCATDEKPCDSMIFYENDFSLLNRSQAESRPEKMEREKPISYYDFFCSDMDKYIITGLIRKEDASMNLMGYARKYGVFGKSQAELRI